MALDPRPPPGALRLRAALGYSAPCLPLPHGAAAPGWMTVACCWPCLVEIASQILFELFRGFLTLLGVIHPLASRTMPISISAGLDGSGWRSAVGENPHRSYSRRAWSLFSATHRCTREMPRPRAQPITVSTRA